MPSMRKTVKLAKAQLAERLREADEKEASRVEICRSFSFKLNLDKFCAQKTFESREFFQSAKGSCYLDEAAEYADKLAAFCKQQVLNDVRAYIVLIKAGQELSVIEDQRAGELRMKQITANGTAKQNSRAFEEWQAKQVRNGGLPTGVNHEG